MALAGKKVFRQTASSCSDLLRLDEGQVTLRDQTEGQIDDDAQAANAARFFVNLRGGWGGGTEAAVDRSGAHGLDRIITVAP